MATHRIARQVIEIVASDRVVAERLAGSAGRAAPMLAAVIERAFDGADDQTLRRIDRLDVRLPRCDPDRFEASLASALEDALAAALRIELARAEPHDAVADALDLLTHYAGSGLLPWWATGEAALTVAAETLAGSRGDLAADGLRFVLRLPDAGGRLARALSAATLARLVARLTGIAPDKVATLAQAMVAERRAAEPLAAAHGAWATLLRSAANPAAPRADLPRVTATPMREHDCAKGPPEPSTPVFDPSSHRAAGVEASESRADEPVPKVGGAAAISARAAAADLPDGSASATDRQRRKPPGDARSTPASGTAQASIGRASGDRPLQPSASALGTGAVDTPPDASGKHQVPSRMPPTWNPDAVPRHDRPATHDDTGAQRRPSDLQTTVGDDFPQQAANARKSVDAPTASSADQGRILPSGTPLASAAASSSGSQRQSGIVPAQDAGPIAAAPAPFGQDDEAPHPNQPRIVPVRDPSSAPLASPTGHGREAPAASLVHRPSPSHDALYLAHAGVALLWPLFPDWFALAGLWDAERGFVDAAAPHRAAALIDNLVTDHRDPPEPRLPLAKLLAGLPIDAVHEPGAPLTDAEVAATATMLRHAIAAMPMLGRLSVTGLRQAWLARPGRLGVEHGGWVLRVEARPWDLLLDRVPWPVAEVALPWMPDPVRVAW